MPGSGHAEIRIVPFEERLLGQAAAAYQLAWGMEEAYSERFSDHEARQIVRDLPDFWLAMAGDEIAGFVAGIPVADSDDPCTRAICANEDRAYYIDSVVVLRPFRRRGIGGRLLQFLIEAASRRGFTEFLLRTTLHRANPAAALYRKHDFEILTDDRGLPVVRIARQARWDGRADEDARLYMASVRPDPLASPALPPELEEFALAVRKGLLNPRGGKSLPNRFIYDEKGSRIFELVCALPEYYPTRCEAAIVEERSDEIAQFCEGRVAVVELGAGSAVKTRSILSAILRKEEQAAHVAYVPIDISAAALQATASALRAEYPALTIDPFAGSYEAGLRQFDHAQYDTVLVLWLGTSIGNIEPWQAEELLGKIEQACGPRAIVLLGIDLKKDKARLERAYDDPQGVTASFNLNLLDRINGELGGHFDLSQFEHRARYDEVGGRIQMHIMSRRRQTVAIDKIGVSVDFEESELIHTENSYKFSVEEIGKLAWNSGFRLSKHWRDSESLVSLNLLETGRDP